MIIIIIIKRRKLRFLAFLKDFFMCKGTQFSKTLDNQIQNLLILYYTVVFLVNHFRIIKEELKNLLKLKI